MSRFLLAGCFSVLLTVGAHPLHARPSWWFWLNRPERHGSRKMAGDFRPIHATYRNHSRQDEGLLRFLHFARHRHVAMAHRYAPEQHSVKSSRPRSLAL